MVIGIGALASLGLALPTGLAFGYGYGYGVRQGYSAFKPPSKTANDLKLSANPVTGALGAGLQSAEERTGQKTPVGTLTPEPSLGVETSKTVSSKPEYVNSKVPGVGRLPKSMFKSHEQYVDFVKRGIHPVTGKLDKGAEYAKRYKRLTRTHR